MITSMSLLILGWRFLYLSTFRLFDLPHRFLNKLHEFFNGAEAIRTTAVNVFDPTCKFNWIRIGI